jgi:hypothetical protein
MTPSTIEGYAAGASALPESALRATVLRCSELLAHTAELAHGDASGSRPNHGARYILETIQDLQPELEQLRAHLAVTSETEA